MKKLPVLLGVSDRSELVSFEARTFVARNEALGGTKPTAEYCDALLRGMHDRRLPAAYVEQVSRQLTEARTAKTLTSLPKAFEVATDWASIEELVIGLRALLQALADGDIPAPGYDETALRRFCESAIKNQRSGFANIRAGSWAVTPSYEPLCAEARIDVVLVPTYLVVAILARVRLTMPGLASDLPGFEEALRQGMLFASHRQLEGHGYDHLCGMCEAVGILALGRVPELIRQDRSSALSCGTRCGERSASYPTPSSD